MPLVFRLCLCRVACLLIYRSELLGVAVGVVHSNIVDLLLFGTLCCNKEVSW